MTKPFLETIVKHKQQEVAAARRETPEAALMKSHSPGQAQTIVDPILGPDGAGEHYC